MAPVKPKKLVVFLQDMRGGGAERAALNLLRHLDRSLFKPCLVLIQKEGEYLSELPSDIEVITLESCPSILRPAKLLWYAQKLKQLLQQHSTDTILSYLINPSLIMMSATQTISKDKRPRRVITVCNNLEHNLSGLTKLRRMVKQNWIVHSFSRAEYITTMSKGIKQQMVEDFGIPGEQIIPIYNPIEIDKIQSSLTVGLPEVARENSEKLMIAVGRLAPQKGYFDLLDAFVELRKRLSVRLLILGEGALRSELEAYAAEKGIKAYVSMPGFVENPWQYLSSADVFVLSSHWEGFGNVIVEAMACSTPVVSTDCPYGPSEIINDGVNGLLVPVGKPDLLAEAVLKVLQEPKLSEIFVSKSRVTIEAFQSEKITTEFERIL